MSSLPLSTRQKSENQDKKEAQFLANRHRYAKVWQAIFSLSTVIAIIALVTLIASIINQSFGIVAVESKVKPDTLSVTPLSDLSGDELIQIIRNNLNKNRIRTIERDNSPLAEMSHQQLLELISDNIIKPKVVKSYYLIPSLLNRDAIEAEIAQEYPDAESEFRAWLRPSFITNTMSSSPDFAGVRTALLGSLYLIAITIAFAFPIGVGAAIYLEEYAERESWINRVIQTNIDNLAGVPSIIYGILGLAIFVRALEPITSGAIFGVTD